jgi:hypothetical protein
MNDNPIDKDKVAENPGLLPYAHTVGSAVIRPEDKGKIKSRALTAMRQQTERQMSQLYKQMQLIAEQANEIKKRVEISEKIYSSEIGFEPIVGETYYLYEKPEGTNILSMIGPNEWGSKIPYQKFISQATLLADHTWDIKGYNE